MTNRRQFLAGLTALSLAGPSWATASAGPILVVVTLRGALDGLHAFPAVGDPWYRRARGSMALPSGVSLPLDGTFAMHPAMASLLPLYEAGELLVCHAVGTAYRGRSHFDGQDHLESALVGRAPGHGWLGRAVAAAAVPPMALALGARVPLVLRGAPAVRAIDPRARSRHGRLDAIAAGLYAEDPLLGPAMAEAMQARQMLEARPPRTRDPLGVAGSLLGGQGASVVALDVDGFDTHSRQGLADGQLANRLGELARGLESLRASLGEAWSRTVVVVASEFGRTVAGNGTGGTDHGTGGAAMVLGGAVAGGRVLADWPGLESSALLDGRDLRPTLDLHGILAGVVRDHLGVNPVDVFPSLPTVVDGVVRG